MAYRLAMMSFAAIAFLALWDLVRRLAGRRGAYFAVLLAATTPFLVHEVWFTWPKMVAAAMVLLAAICVIQRRPLQGGLLVGFGYLMHPGALLAVPTLGLIALGRCEEPSGTAQGSAGVLVRGRRGGLPDRLAASQRQAL